jgi:hypothetical protein
LAVALAGRLLFFGLSGLLSGSRYITGTLYLAIDVPFELVNRFSHLTDSGLMIFSIPGWEDLLIY